MDSFIDKRDLALLDQDKCTYFVMRRVLEGEFDWALTDHARLIICHSRKPYPIWIWTADDASLGVIEWAYREIARRGLFLGNRFIVKCPVADYFAERSAANGRTIHVHSKLLAYECPHPIAPAVRAEGGLHRCSAEDADVLAMMMEEFYGETRTNGRQDLHSAAEEMIAAGNVFLWRDGAGRDVACCRYSVSGDRASISLVYTRPAFRRRHCAATLVYDVSTLAAEAGYMPMLYADAEYPASNACYEKIGFIPRGKLCEIAEF